VIEVHFLSFCTPISAQKLALAKSEADDGLLAGAPTAATAHSVHPTIANESRVYKHKLNNRASDLCDLSVRMGASVA
jgi:hypothetical protein